MAQEFGGQVGIWIIYNNDSDFSSTMSVLDRQRVLFIYWKEAADNILQLQLQPMWTVCCVYWHFVDVVIMRVVP